MGELEGRVAMVTGGAGRLGSAIATELANAGAAVGVVETKTDAAAELAARLRAHGARRRRPLHREQGRGEPPHTRPRDRAWPTRDPCERGCAWPCAGRGSARRGGPLLRICAPDAPRDAAAADRRARGHRPGGGLPP